MATAAKSHSRNGAAKNRIAAKEVQTIELREIDKREFQVGIRGTSPLIVHKFSDKARQAIEVKQQKKAKAAKEARDPKSEYLAAFYMMPRSKPAGTKGAKYGIPAAGFKKICMKAAKFADMFSTACQAFHILDEAGGLVQLSYSAVAMREDTIRLPNGNLDLRYRPEFTDWYCTLRIRYNASSITPEQIINLLQHGGFAIGWGELRPEKGFSNGMFEVETRGLKK